jgi:RNA polymerase subunit RPABC4/transcription elongation factor Spt4
MRLIAAYCKHCHNHFQGNLEHCPFCGKRSPHGTRNLRLKWIAVLIFLTVLAFVVYAFLKSPDGK